MRRALLLVALTAGCAVARTPEDLTVMQLQRLTVMQSITVMRNAARPPTQTFHDPKAQEYHFVYSYPPLVYVLTTKMDGTITSIGTSGYEEYAAEWLVREIAAQQSAKERSEKWEAAIGSILSAAAEVYTAQALAPKPQPIVVSSGSELRKLNAVRRIEANVYIVDNRWVMQTRHCYQYAYGEGAIYDPNERRVIWGDASTCEVLGFVAK